jgi:hypothetical protein
MNISRTRTLRAIAACAAVALVAAGCGGDDDDDTQASTPAAVTTVAGAAATTSAGAATTTTAGGVTGATAAGSPGASTGDPQLAADCAAIESALREAGTLDSVPTPSLGGEIDERTADAAGEVADQLDGVDLQNDELGSAIDDIKDAFQKIAGGGTYTEDMQNAGRDAYLTIGQLCAPYFTDG